MCPEVDSTAVGRMELSDNLVNCETFRGILEQS